MKKQITIIIFVLLLMFVILFIWLYFLNDGSKTSELENKEQLVFRMAVNEHMEYPSRQASQMFADLVEERTSSEVKILLYDENEIGSETNITEQIEFGGIDFAVVSSLYLVDYADELKILLLPNMFDTEDDMMNAMNSDILSNLLRESLKMEKINVLAWYQGPKRGIFSDTLHMNNLIGEKIRVPESQLKINEISAVGFSPVPAKFEEVNNYLKSDYIEGAEGNLLEYYYNSTYNVADNFNFIPWSMIPEVIIASNTAMQQLTIEQQQIVLEAAAESAQYERTLLLENEEKVIYELEEKGIKFKIATYSGRDSEPYVFERLYNDVDSETIENIRQIIDKVGKDEG